MKPPRLNTGGRGIFSLIGCGAFLLWASFWVAVIFVAVHFIRKVW